jgi:mannose-6-phosphate isomerase-like protein (cupin superfamily)
LTSPFPPFVRNGLDAQPIHLPDLGLELRVLIPAAASGGSTCLFEEVTRPGGGPPLHVHARQDECFYFLEGAYLLHVGGKEWRVGPGDVAVVPRGVPHAFVNVGIMPGRLLFSLTPALEGERFFFELVDELKDGPPDPARLNRRFAAMGFSVVGPPLLARG